jgi:hypothetical protein
MTTYCGNNKFELESGNKVLGTPYQCLKKGVGVGLNAPSPGTTQYEPIDPPAPTFCGTGQPPEGKVTSTRGACFRKGFGVGQRLKDTRAASPSSLDSYDGSDISEARMAPFTRPSRAPLAQAEDLDGYNFSPCLKGMFKGPITVRKVFMWVCLLAVMFIILSFLLFSIKVVFKISGTLILLAVCGYLILNLLGYL